jgi:hypothetical protein
MQIQSLAFHNFSLSNQLKASVSSAEKIKTKEFSLASKSLNIKYLSLQKEAQLNFTLSNRTLPIILQLLIEV